MRTKSIGKCKVSISGNSKGAFSVNVKNSKGPRIEGYSKSNNNQNSSNSRIGTSITNRHLTRSQYEAENNTGQHLEQQFKTALFIRSNVAKYKTEKNERNKKALLDNIKLFTARFRKKFGYDPTKEHLERLEKRVNHLHAAAAKSLYKKAVKKYGQ